MIQYIDDGDVAVFDNLSFRKDKRTGYYLNAKTHKRLHVYVWEYYNGEIPEGYHIHHKDFDKSNNEIDNLVMLAASEHEKIHGNNITDEERKRRAINMRENAMPKAKEWHGSEEGSEWHKKHYESMKEALYQKKMLLCDNCGSYYFSIDHGTNRFCSNNCRSAYRRRMGIDNETRKCEWCGKEFIVNKYAKTKTCSRSCRSKLYWNKGNKEG